MNPNPPTSPGNPPQIPVPAPNGSDAPPPEAKPRPPQTGLTGPAASPAPTPPVLAYRTVFKPLRPPLGETPEEREPIPNVLALIEAILRQPRRVMYQLRQPGSGRLTAEMLLVAVFCSLVYGVVVGTFSGGAQLWAAPVKVAGGLVLSALVCLPSLYVLTCLSGSRARLPEVCGLFAGLLVLTTILLIGFAPVAWLFSQSTESVVCMGALHLTFWVMATFFGLRFLETGFAHSTARSAAGLNAWIVIFLLVVLQMTTALRPFVGKADTFLPHTKQSFVGHWQDCLKGR